MRPTPPAIWPRSAGQLTLAAVLIVMAAPAAAQPPARLGDGVLSWAGRPAAAATAPSRAWPQADVHAAEAEAAGPAPVSATPPNVSIGRRAVIGGSRYSGRIGPLTPPALQTPSRQAAAETSPPLQSQPRLIQPEAARLATAPRQAAPSSPALVSPPRWADTPRRAPYPSIRAEPNRAPAPYATPDSLDRLAAATPDRGVPAYEAPRQPVQRPDVLPTPALEHAPIEPDVAPIAKAASVPASQPAARSDWEPPRADFPDFDEARAAAAPEPETAPEVDPRAPRRDAAIFRLGRPADQTPPIPPTQTQPEADAPDPGADVRAEASPPPVAPSVAPAGPPPPVRRADGASPRYYSVHREAGRRPDPTPIPDPVFLDFVPVDLAEPPPPPVQVRQSGLAPSVADSPVP